MYGNIALTFEWGSFAGLKALSCPAFKWPSFENFLIPFNAFYTNGFPVETYDGRANRIESVCPTFILDVKKFLGPTIGFPSSSLFAAFGLKRLVSPIAVEAGYEKRPKRILVPY